MRDQGIDPNPLFSLPGVTLDTVCLDILHCCDLGCSQDALGNLMWEAVREVGFVPGANIQERVRSLWILLKEHYKTLKTPCCLQALSIEMIKQTGKPPKLRAKGAETRGLVPFGVEIAQLMCSKQPGPHTLALLRCMTGLLDFYVCLTLDEFKPELAYSSCQQFCSFYSALSKEGQKKHGTDLFWRVKPKFHLFCELAQFQCKHMGNPRLYWNYLDEDFVGWIALIAASKGGPKQCSTTARKVLDRYRALAG
eukprot:4961493-Lingulodinium_polyedra.AAC.1